MGLFVKGILTLLVGFLLFWFVSFHNDKVADYEQLKKRIPETHFQQLESTASLVSPGDDRDVFKRYVANLKALTYDGFNE
jgi:hypothetical protein